MKIKKHLFLSIFATFFAVLCNAGGAYAVDYPFSLTTTELAAGDTFQFSISAAGEFYIDCGTGGTLSGNTEDAEATISGVTITKSNTSIYTYLCTYSTGNVKTIRFGGEATEYRKKGATIRFLSPTLVASIYGNLATIFPALGTSNGQYPAFINTFSECENLTSIPENLFSGITTGGVSMFSGTFEACTGLTSIPENLFSGITSGGSNMFNGTFSYCEGLSGYVPPTLFSGLISNNHPYSTNMMTDLFEGTGLDETCPGNTVQYITGYEQYWSDKVSCGSPIVCQPGYYLPVNTETCNTTCPSGYVCPGGTFGFNAVADQGITYTVSYDCGSGTGDAPSGVSQMSGASFNPAANTCVAPSGLGFVGWRISGTDTIVTPGTPFVWAYNESKTLVAQYMKYTFSMTTAPIAMNGYIYFSISAQGAFTVFCGDGGTLSGLSNSANATVSDGMTITKLDTSNLSYKCTYSTPGEKTVIFDGLATAYNTNVTTAAILFGRNSKAASLSGDLSAIFPFFSSTEGEYPTFYQSFEQCSTLTSIPGTLFSGYTMGAKDMFRATFGECTGLTSIPENLFANITTGGYDMFSLTFFNCTGLTSIPENLFRFGGNVVQGESWMFASTFSGCTGLTSIPENLFSNVTSGASYMFSNTFGGCKGLTSIPENLFSNVTSGANYMFASTFSGCSGLTSIPSNLFSKVTTGAERMFAQTFSGCSNISGYLPPSTFAGLIANNHPNATYMWYNTFNGTQLATECPTGTTQYITGYEGTSMYSTWNGRVSCEPTVALNVAYSCGSGGGNAPSGTTATYNSSFTPASNTCTKAGNVFNGWLVSGEGVVKPAGTAFTWDYVNDKTFTAQWLPNIINMTFDGGDARSCTYGGTFLPPTPPARPGYVFTGWKIKPK